VYYVVYQRLCYLAIFLRWAIGTVDIKYYARILAYILWGVAPIWGFNHSVRALVEMPKESGVHFSLVREFVPNFPSMGPFTINGSPFLFEATGDCGEISWPRFS